MSFHNSAIKIKSPSTFCTELLFLLSSPFQTFHPVQPASGKELLFLLTSLSQTLFHVQLAFCIELFYTFSPTIISCKSDGFSLNDILDCLVRTHEIVYTYLCSMGNPSSQDYEIYRLQIPI